MFVYSNFASLPDKTFQNAKLSENKIENTKVIYSLRYQSM
ncbi:hypothetical protein PCIT_a3966 [Pseudoalteromonas citrea]|uniref:Uncharacterized protein n=1 Tax=Pseudoalteromonas citrea TaxID=43655 RepID=A0AAD4FS08_9GAMM|nr:hypothetical protein PCIT_a3966 [Pseudoalteromonas citrea]